MAEGSWYDADIDRVIVSEEQINLPFHDVDEFIPNMDDLSI